MKIAPAASEPETPPIAVTITFSRRVDRRAYARARPIVRIEIGIAASITCPTFRPEYAEATVKMTQRRRPQPTERTVSSGTRASAGTTGRYSSPAASGTYAFAGSDFESGASMFPPAEKGGRECRERESVRVSAGCFQAAPPGGVSRPQAERPPDRTALARSLAAAASSAGPEVP